MPEDIVFYHLSHFKKFELIPTPGPALSPEMKES